MTVWLRGLVRKWCSRHRAGGHWADRHLSHTRGRGGCMQTISWGYLIVIRIIWIFIILKLHGSSEYSICSAVWNVVIRFILRPHHLWTANGQHILRKLGALNKTHWCMFECNHRKFPDVRWSERNNSGITFSPATSNDNLHGKNNSGMWCGYLLRFLYPIFYE